MKINLIKLRQREIERGVTLFGPHRDDLFFLSMIVMYKHLVHRDNKEQRHYRLNLPKLN